MATARPKPEISSEKLSNDFLTCPLCFDLFNSPKVLQCQHTFCLPCLRQYTLARGFACTVPCPMCKEVTPVPQNDVSQLKNNYTIVNLLQCVEESWKIATEEKSDPLLEQSSSVSGVSLCGACNEMKGLVCYCENCSIWLCSTCTTSHRRIPVTSLHTLQTNEEIDVVCKRIAGLGQKSVQELKQSNEDKTEIILGQIEQLPVLIDEARSKIEATGDNACRSIREEQNKLLQQLELFQRDQRCNFSRKLQILEDQSTQLANAIEVLNTISISTDGCQNYKRATAVEREIKSITPLQDFPENPNDFLSLTFTPYRCAELKHSQLGSLHMVKGCPSQPIYLKDHSLQMHKTATLIDRQYITGLAINKFAEKFVTANNESVYVFKPDYRQPKKFLSVPHFGHSERPWGIAYCESSKTVFITVAGEYEGEGAVKVYKSDGKEHMILASGLTLPRGIALRNGYVYVCDQIDRCVYILNSNGSIHKLIKKIPDGRFLFDEPMFVSVGANGRMAVSDGYHCVKIFDSQFNLIFTYTPSLLDCELWDVLVLYDGTTVVCDWKHGLHKISADFQSNGLISVEGNSHIRLHEPSALASLENSNIIYVGNGMGEICSAI